MAPSKACTWPCAESCAAIPGEEAVMTPSRKPMETYLNLHAHRPAASPSETVVRNYILPLPPSGHEEPEYGQTFSAGIHPWYIPAHPEETLKELERLAASPSCKSIGEAGLDKYASTPLPLQRELFIRQAELAVSRQLPVIIHCVKAWDELLAIKKTSQKHYLASSMVSEESPNWPKAC